MTRGLIIKYFFLLLYIPSASFSQEMHENILENNIARITIENYYYAGTAVRNTYAIIFVNCNGDYYYLYDTTLDFKDIGYQRYFYDTNINITGRKVSTAISNEKLPLNEFIAKYLVKKDNENYYNVYEILNQDLFISSEKREKINSILFAAQYNYNFLILGEYGSLNLYLPENYPRLEAQ